MISWLVFGSALLTVVVLLHDSDPEDFRGREIREARVRMPVRARTRGTCPL